jgi:hypothetical protein
MKAALYLSDYLLHQLQRICTVRLFDTLLENIVTSFMD